MKINLTIKSNILTVTKTYRLRPLPQNVDLKLSLKCYP